MSRSDAGGEHDDADVEPPIPEHSDVPVELRERDQWLLFSTDHTEPRQPHWRGDFKGISWSVPR